MNESGSFALTAEDEELRRKNLKTVEYYMTLRGPERRAKRAPLFADGAGFELTFTAACTPAAKPAMDWNTVGSFEMFPDWGFYDSVIYQTQDPSMFFVECDGRGRMILPDDPETLRIYENHYIISFEMQDGLIKRLREIHNPCCLMKALGVPLPVVPIP
jgi:phenazine biosynthesis protein